MNEEQEKLYALLQADVEHQHQAVMLIDSLEDVEFLRLLQEKGFSKPSLYGVFSKYGFRIPNRIRLDTSNFVLPELVGHFPLTTKVIFEPLKDDFVEREDFLERLCQIPNLMLNYRAFEVLRRRNDFASTIQILHVTGGPSEVNTFLKDPRTTRLHRITGPGKKLGRTWKQGGWEDCFASVTYIAQRTGKNFIESVRSVVVNTASDFNKTFSFFGNNHAAFSSCYGFCCLKTKSSKITKSS